MTYKPTEGRDAKTRCDVKAVFYSHDKTGLAKYPWSFRIDDTVYSFDKGGFNSSWNTSHIDLVANWEEPVAGDEWGEWVECSDRVAIEETTNKYCQIEYGAGSGAIRYRLKKEPVEHTRWVNLYSNERGDVFVATKAYKTRNEADKRATNNRTNCIEIKWTEPA
jgi:hypothetical protein